MKDRITGAEFVLDDNSKPTTILFTPDDPGIDKFGFVMQKNDEPFAMGLSTVLQCLQIAEEQGFVPELDESWWQGVILENGYHEAL